MIQLALALAVESLDLPEPFEVGTHPLGVRLSGLFEGDLAEARARMARAIEGLPAETEVHDLLLGVKETLRETVARLHRPPSASTAFAVRHAAFGRWRVARLFGMYQLGRPDLLVEYEADVPRRAIEELLGHLARYQIVVGRPFEPDAPIPYGFWLLSTTPWSVYGAEFWDPAREALGTAFLKQAFADERFEAPAPLLVAEITDPDMNQAGGWELGASRAARTMAAQGRAMARLGVEGAPTPPLSSDAAITCDYALTSEGFFAYRQQPANEADSGWHFACDDPAHDHSPSELRVATAAHMLGRYPELLQYLALPPGWLVSFEEGKWWARRPGDERVYLDEGAEPGAPWEKREAEQP